MRRPEPRGRRGRRPTHVDSTTTENYGRGILRTPRRRSEMGMMRPGHLVVLALVVLLLFGGMGLVGFLDDFIKIFKKR